MSDDHSHDPVKDIMANLAGVIGEQYSALLDARRDRAQSDMDNEVLEGAIDRAGLRMSNRDETKIPTLLPKDGSPSYEKLQAENDDLKSMLEMVTRSARDKVNKQEGGSDGETME